MSILPIFSKHPSSSTFFWLSLFIEIFWFPAYQIDFSAIIHIGCHYNGTHIYMHRLSPELSSSYSSSSVHLLLSTKKRANNQKKKKIVAFSFIFYFLFFISMFTLENSFDMYKLS